MRVRPFLSFLLALVFALPLPAAAQITITAGDFEAAFGPGVYGQQTLTAQSGETAKVQAILDAIGPGGTYDFSTIGVSASFSQGEIQARPFDASVPTDADFDGADYVDVSDIATNSPLYSFYRIEDAAGGDPDGYYEYGDLTPSSFFSSKTTYTPPLRVFPFPLTENTTWSSGDVTMDTYTGGTLDSSVVASRSGAVIGYGDLVLPGGKTLPALVHRLVQVDGQDTTRAISFVTKSQDGSVTVLTDGNRNVIEIPLGTGASAPAAFILVRSEGGAEAAVSANETGLFLGGNLGASIEITSGSSTDGVLRGYRVAFPSFNNVIDDSGTPAGFPVTNVSQDGFWVITATSMDATYTVCLDYSGTTGIVDESELAVLKRDNASVAWVPQQSVVDAGAQTVCAAGLNAFSEFALGGSSANPLPVELAGLEAQLDGDAVHLTWQTASETNNAGFEVERSPDGDRFSAIGFVPGGHTSADARTYRFTDAAPPFAADELTYRLRQVDHDGTTRIAGTVEVALRIPEQVALFSPFPNPAQDQLTLRYALPTEAHVEITVYNVLGQRVATLLNRPQPAGRTEIAVDGSRWATGTYFVRMVADRQIRTRRLSIVR